MALETMEGPLLVFGGPYSNLEATAAVLAEARRRGIAPSNVVCTGDVVAYGADAAATVALVRSAGIRVIMGNCEESLAAGAGDCGCGFAAGSACDALAAAWYAHADRQLGADDRRWMAGLPRRLDISVAGLRLAVVHGAIAAINRFVFASTPTRVMEHDLAIAEVDGIIAGHCGLPFSRVLAGQDRGCRLWHNAGAIGLPANDGTPRTWFSVLTPMAEPRSLAIEHVPLAYDHATAARKTRDAGLPAGYAEALATGLWPSCDVLPKAEARLQGVGLAPGMVVWRRDAADGMRETAPCWPAHTAAVPRLDPFKFHDPQWTAAGERRAKVGLKRLETLWINTGTLCNLACANCYIESTPRNDRLVYISAREVSAYLDEIERDRLGTRLIGFTGGEPFMNRDLPAMLEEALSRGFAVLVLTNAMKPMRRFERQLVALRDQYGAALTIRVSIDHYTRDLHELERGPRSWRPSIDGLLWLAGNGFSINVAGRLYSGETEPIVRAGYARLFAEHSLALDAYDPVDLVIFPEMDERADVPEISEGCWGILGKSPDDVMCATSRMVVKRKGADKPAVLSCTLLAYDAQFELGHTLAEASGAVALNHPHCAKFCVLGGAACSAR
jgi:uncharacterized radical SAM superfamily Fe-S cluster-containing enzyme